MKYLGQLEKLASKFETKIAQYIQHTQSQNNTSDLFFGGDNQQQQFSREIGQVEVVGERVVGSGAVGTVLANFYNKTNRPCSFSLSVTAKPNVGASIQLKVNPIELQQSVYKSVDNLFKKFTNMSMSDKQKEADQKAKEGQGSGSNQISDMDLNS